MERDDHDFEDALRHLLQPVGIGPFSYEDWKNTLDSEPLNYERFCAVTYKAFGMRHLRLVKSGSSKT